MGCSGDLQCTRPASQCGSPLDSRCWDVFFHDASKQIYRYASFHLADRSDVEDVVQVVWETFFKKLDKFDTSRALLPWLIGIAQNTVRMYYRRRAWEQPVSHLREDGDLDSLSGTTVGCDQSSSNTLSDAEVRLIVQYVIRAFGFNDYQATIFVLTAEEGLQPRDVAAILNCKPEKISQDLWIIRKEIGKKLHQEDIGF